MKQSYKFNFGKKKVSGRALLVVWLIVVFASRLPTLASPLTGQHSFRQTQTAFVAKSYLESGINLLSYRIQIFGQNNSEVPFEFPLFQAVVAALAFITGNLDFTGRFLSLVFFLGAIYIWYLLIRRWFDRSAALVFVLLASFTPFALQWSAAFLMEFFAVFLGTLMVWLFQIWEDHRKYIFLLLASMSSIFVALVKITTLPAFFLLLLIPILNSKSRRSSQVFFAAILGLSSFVIAAIWTYYADSVKKENPFTEFLVSSNLRDWNFGTLVQRFEIRTYIPILERVNQEILGIVGVLVIVAYTIRLLILRKSSIEFVVMVGACIVTPLLFINLYFVHSYYLCAIYIQAMAVVAVAMSELIKSIPKGLSLKVVFGAVALILQGAYLSTSPLAIADIKESAFRKGLSPIASEMKQLSAEGNRFLLVNCDWDPTLLYTSGSKGVMIPWWSEQIDEAYVDKVIEEEMPIKYLINCETQKGFPTVISQKFQIEQISSIDSIYKLTPLIFVNQEESGATS